MNAPLTIRTTGFGAFSSVQGKRTPYAGPNKGISQADDGTWYGWRIHPPYTTSRFPTRAQAKIALIKGLDVG